MANDLSASKLVGYALEKASGKDSIGSGKLAAYSVLSSGQASFSLGRRVTRSCEADPLQGFQPRRRARGLRGRRAAGWPAAPCAHSHCARHCSQSAGTVSTVRLAVSVLTGKTNAHHTANAKMSSTAPATVSWKPPAYGQALVSIAAPIVPKSRCCRTPRLAPAALIPAASRTRAIGTR